MRLIVTSKHESWFRLI